MKADLVLLAMGFVHPTHQGLLEELGVKRDGRGNVDADTERYQTSVDKVFAAGGILLYARPNHTRRGLLASRLDRASC